VARGPGVWDGIILKQKFNVDGSVRHRKNVLIYSYIQQDATGFFFAVVLRPNAGHGLLILEVTRSHTTTHHSR